MELKLDTSKIYAIALEGGGARGAWQVGAWRALEEAGVRYNAVSGTSVGAINGALMAMRDLTQAEQIWKDIRFSQIINVSDEDMGRIMGGGFENLAQVKSAFQTIKTIISDRGLDVEPLKNLLAERVDEDKIRNSGVELFLTTVSVTDRKELEIDVKDLAEGEIKDMIMASAYHPAFKQAPIGGKTYADGGFYDLVPISALVSRGYKDLIVLRLNSFGIERRVKIPEDVTVTTIAPYADLGNVLNFSSDQSAVNMVLGYYDAQRVLYGLYGHDYYIDRTMTEEEAYELLVRHLRPENTTLRQLNEDILPRFAKRLDCDGDYYDIFICMMERLAASCSLTPYRIRTDREFYEEVMALRTDDIPDKPDKVLDLFLVEE
ncbi:MAG: patatin-like phospholipase family protein [Ruminococcaceae bacterium]|nr:patatin-like phospholipase family protein [Oscillospiraceae bacterium]